MAKSKKVAGSLANPTKLRPLDKGDGLLQVIIETPKGCRNKFAFDVDQRIFALKKVGDLASRGGEASLSSLLPSNQIHLRRGGDALGCRREHGMSKEWVEKLAGDIKRKNHEAAQRYGRDQHYAGIIATLGKEFFVALVGCVQENVDAIRRQLQGDATAAEMGVERGASANEIRITRARFPWVDARVTHHEDTIALDYAKDPGRVGDPKLERTVRTFVFRVAADDSLYVEDAFADQPLKYETAEALARRITEVLFSV